MKQGFYIVLLAMLGIAGIVSCNKDRCKEVTCIHGTTENKGGGCTCTCDSGYLGKYCDTLEDRLRYKFLQVNGDTTSWMSVDTCGTVITSYQCVFLGDTATKGIWMLNFRNYGRLDTIPLQVSGRDFGFLGQINVGNNAITNLLGTISPTGDTIQVTYYYGNNTATDSCHGTWLKR